MKKETKKVWGISLMSLTHALGQALFSTFLVFFITDYVNIEGQMSSTMVAAMILPVLKLVDAANDPLQGWVMDRMVFSRKKSYKFFCTISILLEAFSVVMMFCIPDNVSKNAKFAIPYIIVFYLLFDFGSSFYADGALRQVISTDKNQRIKYVVFPRVVGFIIILPLVFVFRFASANEKVLYSDSHAIGIYITILMLIAMGLSLGGTSMVDEEWALQQSRRKSGFHILDVFRMLKKNPPLFVFMLGNFFVGFIYIMLITISNYFVKWNYCFDAKLGIVLEEKFAHFSMILGIVEYLPFLFGTIVGAVICKREKNPAKGMNISILITAFMGVVMLMLQIFQQFSYNSDLYFAMLAFLLFGCGLSFVPGSLLSMECMDYALWKTGKPTNASIQNFSGFLTKLQTSGCAAFFGAFLIIFGYQIRIDADTYIGEKEALEAMLQWFGYVSAVIPVVVGLIAYVIFRKYPLKNEERTKMIADLQKRRERENG
ncbi:MAG: MFS transporter [Lachnospiraceae bacterium]|nr:MFS transporter [Lachnospiraceae bacterium]